MAKKEKSQPGNGQAQAAQNQSSQDQSQQNQTQPEFIIQRIYIKDISYEAPNTPQIFRQDWQPTINLDINTKSSPLEQNIHEVVLTVTATAKLGETTAFLAEVKQAGIFTIQRFPEDQIKQLLGSYCPGILFPYAREVVTDLVTRGGFPPLYLAPINFDILYQQHLQAQANKDQTGTDTRQ